jgi:uncharacterized membrane protein
MNTRSVRSVVYFAAGLGLIVAVFAAAEFYDASLQKICSFSSYFSCQLIDQSGLTSTLGIQDWVWGVGGFVVILVVAALAEQHPGDRPLAYALLGVTSLGVALSVYLLYVEVLEIHALCPVCATAYLLGGVAWLGAIELVRRTPGDLEDDDEESDGSDDDAE